MWVSDQQILKAVRAGLTRLGADLAGTSSAHLLGAINIAVGELASRAEGRMDSMLESCSDAKRIALRGVALTARIGTDEFSARAHALPEAPQSGLVAIEATYSIIKQLLVECALSLNAAVSSGEGDDAWRRDVGTFFLELAKHDAKRAAQSATPPEAETESRGPSLDVDSLKRYFAACKGTDRLPGPLELVDAKLLSGGFSRQTILTKVKNGSGIEESLVIRKQVPGGFLDGACNVLVEEVPFFDLCHKHGLPVP